MTHDVIVIGAGAGGEAAAGLGGELGARVAVVERDLIGGLCSYWACLPSKTLLDAAHRRALGAPYPWARAAGRRDWMISRERIAYPDDTGHLRRLEATGAEVVRGEARVVAPGRVEVAGQGRPPRTLEAPNIVVATGSVPAIPSIEGLEDSGYWTSNDATSARDLPSSIVVMGGGAVGVELAQVFARFGVATTLVQLTERILPRDHPRTSTILAEKLAEDGVDIRTGVWAQKVERTGRGRRISLSDGSRVETAEILIAVGRRPADLRSLGVEEAGVRLGVKGRVRPDDQMRVAEGVFVAGDAAGGMQFTHVADYQGRVAARAALGGDARADLRVVPRTTFTDPETAAVGQTVQEARKDGIDALEVDQDFAETSRGFTIEPTSGDEDGHRGTPGHASIVVDRERRVLVGAFVTAPGASEMIHLPALAIKQRTPLAVLADTITAYPTGARVLGNLFLEAERRLI